MTPEKFDNYSFSIYTEVRIKDESRWERIVSVDFVRRWIETNYHGPLNLEQIEEIRK